MKKTILYCFGMMVVGFVVSGLCWNLVPDLMPSHWNMSGVADKFSEKKWMLLSFPVLSFLVPLGLLAILQVDPRNRNVEQSGRAVHALVVSLSGFFIAMHLMTIQASLQADKSLSVSTLTAGLCCLIMVLGNFMPKVKSNFFLGIRTPWTLDNETVWHKTHRLAGKTMTASGLLGIPTALFLPTPFNFGVSMGIMLLGLIIPTVYSYLYFKEELRKALQPPQGDSA